MADLKKRLRRNVAGEFYVDSTCINCDACRQLAPETFGEADEFSHVYSRPGSNAQVRKALQALLACPTGSIGTVSENDARKVIEINRVNYFQAFE